MFIEEFWAVDLSINAFVHLKIHISAFHALWPVELREFHEERFVFRLGTLTKGQGKVNLLRFLSMGGCQSESSANCRPAY